MDKFAEALRTGRAAPEDTLGGGSATADTVINSVMNLVTEAWRPLSIVDLQKRRHYFCISLCLLDDREALAIPYLVIMVCTHNDKIRNS